MEYHIAIVGATGNVGREILSILAEREFPIGKIDVLASSKSLGREISFGDKRILKIKVLENFSFKGVDIAFFAAGSRISAHYALKAAQAGAVVIDKSSHFRLDPEVPLIVPEVNSDDLVHYKNKNIIANPNCVTIPLAVVLKPLDQVVKIKRVVVSTYQSVSGAGRPHMDELYTQTKGSFTNDPMKPVLFPKPIAFNLIPHIDDFRMNGITGEEEKISLETQKLLGSDIGIFSTCVRVPVFIGHSLSATIEFEKEMTCQKARSVLRNALSLQVIDRREDGGYATPLDCVGEDLVYVSRIRKDPTVPYGLGLWLVSDNLRKGAALNGIQIAELLIKKYF